MAWSQVHTIGQLYAVMIGIGITGAMVLYEPAFAVIVSWFTPDPHATALLVVTIVAGFSSTIFMPLTGLLAEHLGWRGALHVLAVIHGLVTVPLHALTIRRPRRQRRQRPPDHAQRRRVVRGAMRDARFWILAGTFIADGAATSTRPSTSSATWSAAATPPFRRQRGRPARRPVGHRQIGLCR
ncbi:MFS transporter [Micromonospora sp. NPDC005087]|uniref:MFS transporter n=1 Tax=Micromonospora sp. NPDC005087 TaxID=3364225 RepID=UPI00369CFA04